MFFLPQEVNKPFSDFPKAHRLQETVPPATPHTARSLINHTAAHPYFLLALSLLEIEVGWLS